MLPVGSSSSLHDARVGRFCHKHFANSNIYMEFCIAHENPRSKNTYVFYDLVEQFLPEIGHEKNKIIYNYSYIYSKNVQAAR